MKILYINAVCGVGSTGHIVSQLMQEAAKRGDIAKVACSDIEPIKEVDPENVFVVGSKWDYYVHNVLSRFTDHEGLYSKRATRQLIKRIEKFDPDLIHIHNIHGHWINYEILFHYLEESKKKVIWTLHDCWAFTGHCSHFSALNCNKWKTECYDCPGLSVYPKCYTKGDVTENYYRKRVAFTSVQDMTIVTPSKWLANLVKQSFLSKYNIQVINNKVDKTIFKPTPSDFRSKYHIEDKIIVLGVSNVWSDLKGYSDFLELAEILDDRYVVVLVGLTKEQIKNLPDTIIGIERTNNSSELAAIYTAADYYVNASKQETFGMTTLEAAECGKKPIVYKGTAGEEIVSKYGGKAIDPGADSIKKAIIKEKSVKGRGGKD